MTPTLKARTVRNKRIKKLFPQDITDKQLFIIDFPNELFSYFGNTQDFCLAC